MTEARLVEGEGGWQEPEGDGWFVLNARDARWAKNEMGWYCSWESAAARFAELGININVLMPGMPMAMYHQEPAQEDFLVLDGDALLIVEGQERRLKKWDLVHCPRDVPHTILGVGDKGALVLAVGSRVGGPSATYPVDEAAIKHGAGVEVETDSPREAYSRFGPVENASYSEGLLPD
jgi:uncharacterized cupin superfamily protein